MTFEKRTAATRSPNPSSVPRPGMPKETGYSNVNRPCGSRYVAKPGSCAAPPAMALTISTDAIDAEQRNDAWSISDHGSTVDVGCIVVGHRSDKRRETRDGEKRQVETPVVRLKPDSTKKGHENSVLRALCVPSRPSP